MNYVASKGGIDVENRIKPLPTSIVDVCNWRHLVGWLFCRQGSGKRVGFNDSFLLGCNGNRFTSLRGGYPDAHSCRGPRG